MAYFKNILFLFLLLYGTNSLGQIIGSNLVNNPSFEEYDTCPSSVAQLYECKYWWGNSTEYFNACATISSHTSVPLNWFGFQYAHTGNAYAGCGIYYRPTIPYLDYRETIKTKLKDSLIATKRYCTNFYISLAEASFQYANNVFLDSAGMLFTKDPVLDSLTPILSNGVKVQNDILNLDTVNWLKTTNTFKANGGELYLGSAEKLTLHLHSLFFDYNIFAFVKLRV